MNAAVQPPLSLAPVHTTARLVLRRPAAEDQCALRDALTDPANRRFGGEGSAAPQRLTHWEALWERDGLGPWAVLLADRPEQGVIGFGGLSRELVAGVPALLLEFHFRSDVWGCGYAAEMAWCALHLAFDTLKAGAVQALVQPNNTAARKTLERLGLRLKGSVADHPGQAATLLYEITPARFAALPAQPPEPTPFGA